MPEKRRVRAVRIRDDSPLPSSPVDLAQAIFRDADRKLSEKLRAEKSS